MPPRHGFLSIDQDHLYLDQPQSIGKHINFAAKQTIEAYILLNQNIYTFQSKIVRTQCTIKLNRYTTVDGLCITIPTEIREGQRRHDLRVSLANMDPMPTTVHKVSPDCPGAADLDTAVFKGHLLNLSGGGCRVHLNTVLESKFKIGTPMFLRIEMSPRRPATNHSSRVAQRPNQFRPALHTCRDAILKLAQHGLPAPARSDRSNG